MSIIQSSMQARSKVKVVLLGDQSVGKTSLIQKFIYDKFHQIGYPTVGIDFLAKDYVYHEKLVRLQLWDTAGQQRFRSLIPSYLKDSHCAIIVFDLSNKQSLQNVQSWINLYRENRSQSPIAVLAGNKSDLVQRNCEFEQVELKAKQLGVRYIQVSAKAGSNINELFEICLQQIFQTVLMSSRVHNQIYVGNSQSNSVRGLEQEPQPFPLRNQILNLQNQEEQNQCRC